jgi:hypothetical protein
MSTKPSIDDNVHLDEEGLNSKIKWTFVGRGNKKSDSFHCRSEGYGGLSNMGKKEERVHDSRFS